MRETTRQGPRWRTAVWTAGAVVVVAAAVNAVAAEAWHRNRELTAQSEEMVAAVSDLRAHLVDAETGQRGYLLTGEASYLDPYKVARTRVGTDLQHLRTLASPAGSAGAPMTRLAFLTGEKMRELDTTIALRQRDLGNQALVVVRSDRGKALMDSVRMVTRGLLNNEAAVLAQRRADEDRAGSAVMLVLLAGALVTVGVLAYLFRTLAEYDATQRAAQREMALQMSDLEALARERFAAGTAGAPAARLPDAR